MPRYSRNLADYNQPCRIATPEEEAAYNAGKPATQRPSVPGILRALPVGESHLFTQYQLSSQVSPAIQSAKRNGGHYTCSRELSLIDGECVGVRVTRTS